MPVEANNGRGRLPVKFGPFEGLAGVGIIPTPTNEPGVMMDVVSVAIPVAREKIFDGVTEGEIDGVPYRITKAQRGWNKGFVVLTVEAIKPADPTP